MTPMTGVRVLMTCPVGRQQWIHPSYLRASWVQVAAVLMPEAQLLATYPIMVVRIAIALWLSRLPPMGIPPAVGKLRSRHAAQLRLTLIPMGP